ncbi:MAG: MBL fold metallo-hydrolase [Candidatus Hydrogenedens sp.]|nr:MBL fold metallo-hydrolase [Candidatus Hydrogenedens sp.]
MNDSIDISVLCDNRALSSEFAAEHGLSFYINTPVGKILFDTGQSDVFLRNAKQLSCPLHKVQAVVLSHGHYDHTGGLALAGEILSQALHCFHPQALQKRYRPLEDGSVKNIGMPEPTRVHLSRPEIRCRHTIEPVEILPKVWVTGTVPRIHDFEDRGGPFYMDPECTVTDEIYDDQALWIESSQGLVILMGCAHAGTINTLDYISRVSEKRKIHALLGGMHLKSASERRLDETFAALRRYDIDFLAPCHCTGDEVIERLAKVFPESFRHCVAGSRFSFAI